MTSKATNEVLRYAAFTRHPGGGNPAGVVLDASELNTEQMLHIAGQVGFSETAFITQTTENDQGPRLRARYFSPEIEVDFCGHATIATAVAYAETHTPGQLIFETNAGDIPVLVNHDGSALRATLTSVATSDKPADRAVLNRVLEIFGWSDADLDPQIPARVAFGGVHHLVLGIRDREVLRRMSYPFEDLKKLMENQGWITLQLVWRQDTNTFHSRNPFPVGGVVEDPATGAAAAALGGYLARQGIVQIGSPFEIVQGEDMGRLSRLTVTPLADGSTQVSGAACSLADGS